MGLEKINRFEDAAGDEGSLLLGILFDVLSQADQVPDRAQRPDDFHRGARGSPGFPQDLSHFETLS